MPQHAQTVTHNAVTASHHFRVGASWGRQLRMGNVPREVSDVECIDVGLALHSVTRSLDTGIGCYRSLYITPFVR
jgi:hypothetical protein